MLDQILDELEWLEDESTLELTLWLRLELEERLNETLELLLDSALLRLDETEELRLLLDNEVLLEDSDELRLLEDDRELESDDVLPQPPSRNFRWKSF